MKNPTTYQKYLFGARGRRADASTWNGCPVEGGGVDPAKEKKPALRPASSVAWGLDSVAVLDPVVVDEVPEVLGASATRARVQDRVARPPSIDERGPRLSHGPSTPTVPARRAKSSGRRTNTTSATRTITIKVVGTAARPGFDIDGLIVGS
jgi:hypothetical protein